MSQILALKHDGKLLLGVGLTKPEIETLRAGKSLVFDLDPMQAFAADERPTGLLLVPGDDNEHLIAQFAPFLPSRTDG